MSRSPILAAFFAVAVGIVTADAFGLGVGVAGALAGVGTMLVVVAWRRERGLFLAALLLLAAIGGLSAALSPVPTPLAAVCAEDDRAGRWRGTIDEAVERLPETNRASAETDREVNGEPNREVPAAAPNVRQRTVLSELYERCGNEWQPRHGRISIGLFGGPAVGRGDVVELGLRLEPLDVARNPVGLDPRVYARRHRLAARGAAASPFVVVERGAGPLHALDAVRSAAAAAIETMLPARQAVLAKALSLGDDAAVEPDDQQTWADAGIAHLLAVSGLQVGLLALAQLWLLALCLRRSATLGARWSTRRLAALLSLPGVIAYCLLVGLPPPAVRAGLMSVAYLLGLALGRRSRAANGLGLAGVVLVVVDPTALYDVSFLLSFVGVAALILMPPLPTAPASGRAARLGRWLLGAMATTTAASLLTAPISARFFGTVSLVAPVANVPAVPLASLIATPVAMALALVAPLSPTLGHLLAALLAPLLAALDALARYFAALPGSHMGVRPLGVVELLLYYGVCLAGFWTLRAPRERRRWLVAALPLAALIVVAIGNRTLFSNGSGRLRILHPYVGQGDAALILLPGGDTVLFDAGGAVGEGGFDPGRLVLTPLLASLGIDHIDLAVLSHPHPDHLNGFAWVERRVPIRELWWPGTGAEVPAMAALVDDVRKSGGRVQFASELPLDVERQGVHLRVKHPRPSDAEREGLPYDPAFADNDNSIVLEVVYGERRFTFPGDIEREAEALVAPALQPTDVLKAPHHGSRTSSTDALLAATRPRFVVISCGAGNRFGFPHEEVLERYRAAGVRILRTDRDGMISFATDGRDLDVACFRGCAD